MVKFLKKKIKRSFIKYPKQSKVIVASIIILLVIQLVIKGVSVFVFLDNSGHLVTFSSKDGETIKGIHYGELERNVMDMYIPKDLDPENDNAVILFIHGGSWRSGDKSMLTAYSKRMAKEGYVTVNMNYSYVDYKAGISIYSILDEITLVTKKIKELSDEHNLNIKQMSLCGYSAGGHLALLYGYSMKEEAEFPIVYVAEFVAPIDFEPDNWYDFKDEFNNNAIATMLTLGSGTVIDASIVDSDKARELILDLSPMYHVDEDTLPTLMAYGMLDDFQNPKNGKRLSTMLNKLGVSNYYIEFKNSNHYLANDKDKMELYFEKFKEFSKKYFGY